MSALLPRIERHEARRVALAAACFVCVAAGALVSRAAGDALFLSRFGSSLLPFMYIAGGVTTGLAACACVYLSRRLSTSRIAIAAAGLLVAADLALFLGFRAFPSASRLAGYLVSDLSVRIPIFLFWAFVSEIFDSGASRRVFGLIGAAGTAACLPAGLAVGPLAKRAGTETLVLLAAALLGGFIASAVALLRDEGGRAAPKTNEGLGAPGAGSARRLFGTPQFATLVALAVITSLVETLVDYQFKATLASSTSSSSLAAVFGNIYAAANVASLAVQLLVVHRVLARAGVFASLCVLPATLFLALAGVVRFGSARWVLATKALDITLTTTINGTARQLLYRGIRRESRLTARALAEGLYQPLAIGLTGAGVGVVAGVVSIPAAAAAAAAGCVVWLLVARRAHAAYVAGLLDALEARRFGSSDEPLLAREPAVEAWLRDTLAKAPDEEVVYLAAVLPQLVRLVDVGALRAALARDDPNVKAALLESLLQSGLEEGPALALTYVEHPDPGVRRAAILAASPAAARGAGAAWLTAATDDADARVRAVAAVRLAGAAEPGLRSIAEARIEGMLGAPDAAIRAAVAEALEHAGRDVARPHLLRLLADQSRPVVVAALETIASRPDAALAKPVLALLARPVVAGAATEALVAMGTALVGPLITLVAREESAERDATLARVPDVLARIGAPHLLDVVRMMLLPLPKPEDRTRLYRAYADLLRRHRRAKTFFPEVEELIAGECRAAAARSAALRALGTEQEVRLVRDAVRDLYDCHVLNAFLLLGGRLPDVDARLLHARITGEEGEARSQAMELLENVLPDALRDPFREALARQGPEGEEDIGPAGVVRRLLADRDSEWIAACAAWAAAELSLGPCVPRLRKLLEHESPVVHESALFALGRLE